MTGSAGQTIGRPSGRMDRAPSKTSDDAGRRRIFRILPDVVIVDRRAGRKTPRHYRAPENVRHAIVTPACGPLDERDMHAVRTNPARGEYWLLLRSSGLDGNQVIVPDATPEHSIDRDEQVKSAHMLITIA